MCVIDQLGNKNDNDTLIFYLPYFPELYFGVSILLLGIK